MDSPLPIITASLLAVLVSYYSILWLVHWRTSAVLDYPNSRSLHVIPVPRIGGLGLLLGIILTWGIFSVTLPVALWWGVVMLAGISAADDLWGLPVWQRLLTHCIVAAGFAFLTLDTYDWHLSLFFALTIVWMANLYNFMDGSDGLAGGMTVIGFGYYGLVSLLSHNIDFAVANFAIAAAALGFLFHNFYPARIFLGDSGAVPLGYLAAVMGILGWLDGLWSLWLPLLVFSPFIADASVTLAKRLWRGKKIWQAHREHYYQRLVQSGLGHKNTALLSYSLMLIVGACAVWMNFQDMLFQLIIITVWGFIYLALMLVADLSKKLYSDTL